VIRAFSRFIISLIGVLLWTQDLSFAEEPIIVLVSPFNGEQFGTNIGAVIDLKIWSTLHVAPRRAWVLWSDPALTDSSYKAAEERAAASRATLLLWGSIVKFGNDFLAQPLVVILEGNNSASDDPATWTVSMPSGDSVLSLSVGIPRPRYDLPPVILTQDILESYKTTTSIRIHERQPDGKLGPTIGELGRYFQGLENDGDLCKVQVESGQVGWVRLPELDDEIDLVDFVGGLISLFRRDYPRAISMLRNVSVSSRSTMLRMDSFLLQALAKAKMSQDPSIVIDSALKLNPYGQVNIKFKIMSLIWQMLKGAGGSRQAKISELLKQISDNSYLFSPEDSWLVTSKKIASAAKEQ
jgi:hypothetical protein